ncbi:ABC transporter permease [Saccharothrix deserti]|uniref:ABC transporter permease n=1 Tax=Saccharothrix deserti TaxID=2593674 RepID=UPI00131B13CD|nr:ABC transporter permease [Saccharothrix deserti]
MTSTSTSTSTSAETTLVGTTAEVERTGATGAAKAWSDSMVLLKRNVIHGIREPIEPMLSLMIPIMMMLLLGYVFGGSITVPGSANYREFLIAGIIVMVMAYGLSNTASGMARDTEKAVYGRFRSMPMAASALVTSRALYEMIRGVVETVIVIAVGLLIGWQWHNDWGDFFSAIGILLLLRLALVWGGILLGLTVPAEAVSPIVYPLVFPLTVISSSFVAPERMPEWLGVAAEWNPITSVVNATRELWGNPGVGGDSWIVQNAQLMAVVWPLVLLVLFVPLSIRRFRRVSA